MPTTAWPRERPLVDAPMASWPAGAYGLTAGATWNALPGKGSERNDPKAEPISERLNTAALSWATQLHRSKPAKGQNRAPTSSHP